MLRGRLLLMQIERASAADVPAIERLLEGAGLPLDGCEEAFRQGVVARDREAMLGCAAVEMYGDAGLLRSVAVREDIRGRGLGRDLVAAAEAIAAAAGARELYLLTESAGTWFPRLGYTAVDRQAVPAAVLASVEFTHACPVTALVMRRRIA
jgi:amino-acid N-acetyltransferase